MRHVWESRVLCPLHDPCGLGTDWWLSSESATHLTLFRRRDNNTEQALVEGLRRGGRTRTRLGNRRRRRRRCHVRAVESNMRRTRRHMNLAFPASCLSTRWPRLWSGVVRTHIKRTVGTFPHAIASCPRSVRKRAKRLAMQKLSSGGEWAACAQPCTMVRPLSRLELLKVCRAVEGLCRP